MSVSTFTLFSCKDDKASGSEGPSQPPQPLEDMTAVQLDRPAWYNTYPAITEEGGGKYTVSTDPIKLEFFGWGEAADKTFDIEFPSDYTLYNRAILTYRMGAWNRGPSAWDNTTMFFVYNKYDDQWYEIARAFTPYGRSFGAEWYKEFYLDVTEFLPMLEGLTRFRVYYGGFDATAARAHTVTLTFDLYEGEPERLNVWTAKVYDTSRDGNSGYRAWAYGCQGFDIEDPERMGERTFEIPSDVRSLEMRVAISGHGHDLGDFPDRVGFVPNNAAEFVYNTYTVKINGEESEKRGEIFYSNADNYYQAGTYLYDRANWGPGNPLYTHYWEIRNVPEGGGELTVDMDTERFVSTMSQPNDEGIAQYIIEVDLFGYDR